MTSDVDILLARCGRFGGHGIDHDDQPLYGELELQPLPGRQGAWWAFRATAIDGTVLREERSWVAPDADGRLCLWSVDDHRPGVQRHVRRHGLPPAGPAATLVFGSGDPHDGGVHRVEIAIDLWPDGGVGYRTAWGLPGGEFRPRSQVRMEPQP